MGSKAKVIVLGGGVGGTFVANKLARHSQQVQVTVVDATGSHHYQPGLLYVPFKQEKPETLRYDERKLLHPEVELICQPVIRIEPDRRRLFFSDGYLEYDYLVIATGCCPAPEEIPGLQEGGHHFYSEPDAIRLRDALETFEGGHIVVGIGGFPYKCPPAPIEFTLLLADWLEQNGLRNKTKITFLSPLPQPFSIPTVNPLVEELFARSGITSECFFNAEAVDPQRRMVSSLEGTEINYDLLILIPPHRGSPVVDASGLGDKGGWIPTDRNTLQAKGHDNIFVIGDATDLPISKSGAAAHFEAPIVVANLLALVSGQSPQTSYDGSVLCLVETGKGTGTILRFNYDRPPNPPKPTRYYRWVKHFMNRFYPLAVLKGWSLTLFLDSLRRVPFQRPPFCGSEEMISLKDRQ
ncbi:MAG: NAD(P)/FAD-dependent oxidoreductase [Armatimonadetes bacterium]|nr:NAD(P)/FAD-dependent oxidoreductase [Armatimonadota bacterium]MDW8122588.1 FAD/NAD(P)-binding oxidoreductase [Armatimonadota bacterium]